ncbi:hypothetical protein CHH92_14250 [Bacillus sonorensis]|nr:hypothetical protein [Bacillus sonorensis]PAD59519.1 hypothetical protein CHH92_14250 [Bacillus sonorensis]RHJ09866.1 hypothetical protein DW143_11365 [Bacillus sonorensis]
MLFWIHSLSPRIFYFQLMQGQLIWLSIDGNLKVWLNSGESVVLIKIVPLLKLHKEAYLKGAQLLC